MSASNENIWTLGLGICRSLFIGDKLNISVNLLFFYQTYTLSQKGTLQIYLKITWDCYRKHTSFSRFLCNKQNNLIFPKQYKSSTKSTLFLSTAQTTKVKVNTLQSQFPQEQLFVSDDENKPYIYIIIPQFYDRSVATSNASSPHSAI